MLEATQIPGWAHACLSSLRKAEKSLEAWGLQKVGSPSQFIHDFLSCLETFLSRR